MKNNSGKISPQTGFSLIELIVSMLILVILLGGMTAVAVSAFRSYQKSKAIKRVAEDVGYALNSIAKDVRMGKIEVTATLPPDGSNLRSKLMVTRNRGGKVCYVVGSEYIAIRESLTDADLDCPDNILLYNKIVDLSSTGMTFETASSGFIGCPTATDSLLPGYYPCPTGTTLRRGWVQVNFNIENPTMESDAIRVQTIVSSRDYGWEEL